MCNLYRLKTSAQEVASHFDVIEEYNSNASEEIYPGRPGMVVTQTEGVRKLQSMSWGFPLKLKTMKETAKPMPVNNIADLRKPMWVGLARKPQWRCVIPLNAFAEAEGVKGRKTRTWFSVRGRPIIGWAGLWRVSDEWGPVYSGLMTNANEAVAPVHDRMPVLLEDGDYDRWLEGSYDDALAFQERVFPAHMIDIDPTPELWVKKKGVDSQPASLL